jgi:hypothetical protein
MSDEDKSPARKQGRSRRRHFLFEIPVRPELKVIIDATPSENLTSS